MRQELIDIIRQLKEKITDDSDMVWTRYESAKELRDELETYLIDLETDDIICMEKLSFLFLPTASLQEHSISNNWAQEYLNLSQKFDRIYTLYQNRA